MDDRKHLAKLKDGVDAWNHWRRKSPEIQPNLRGVDLRGANLSGADLRGANLGWAHLTGVTLSRAQLNGANLRAPRLLRADLSGANLCGANLRGAHISGTNLNGADLSTADLSSADFYEVDLSGAKLIKTYVGHTVFANTDLSAVEGLDCVDHAGPSSVSLDTIYKSKGKIPHGFLRGCGVPEEFIEYMAFLVGTGIESYSLFISYSTQDEEFARRLHADLQANGVRCWFAPHNIKGGEKIHLQIDEAIRIYDRLLLVLSPASMASEWVGEEIALACKKEKEQGKEVLFPIGLCPYSEIRKWKLFNADIGKDSARDIREYHIPDFTNWEDHKAYKKAFDRLLADLKGKS
jgi:hypothetical protein